MTKYFVGNILSISFRFDVGKSRILTYSNHFQLESFVISF
jgi:hypothetical protein